jgi:prepilin-type N-terminal cleavage/methylation domain-containing protein
MRAQKYIHDERGFTLYEVLVAIVISSLLIGFGFSVFLFAQKFLMVHERMSDLKDAVDQTLFILSTDIGQSCQVKEVSDTSIVLVVANRRLIIYRFDSVQVERNGIRTHDPVVRLRLTTSNLQVSSGQTVSTRHLRIRVAGERGEARYSAETVALVPWSARQEFIRLVSRKP